MKYIFTLLSLVFTIYSFSQYNTWIDKSYGNDSHLSVYVTSRTNASIGSLNGSILKTTDGGTNWSSASTNNNTNAIYDIHFTTFFKGFAVGDNGTCLVTSDAGYNWTNVNVTNLSGVHLRSVHFADEKTGYISGGTSNNSSGYLFKTIDSGATWTQLNILPSGNIYGLQFRDSLYGLYSTHNGNIFKTEDGGNTWTKNTAYNQQLTDFNLKSSGDYICVGQPGYIIRSVDSGVNWASINSSVTENFYGLHFLDDNDGFIVGGNISTNTTSVIMSTNNGGVTWSAYYPQNTNRLNDVHFDDNIGYTVGMFGSILKYERYDNTTEVLDLSKRKINVYPNPFNERITLESQNENLKDSKIEIINALGETIYSRNITQPKATLNLNSFDSGVYILKFYSNNNSSSFSTIRIIKN